MAYGFKLGQIEGLDSSVEKVNLTITGTTTASYVLNYVNEGGNEGWVDNVENPNFALSYHLELEEYVLIAFNMDESDVGDTYNVTLSASVVEENFKSAVETVLVGNGLISEPETLFDGTITITAEDTQGVEILFDKDVSAYPFEKWTVTVNDEPLEYAGRFFVRETETHTYIVGNNNGVYMFLARDDGGIMPGDYQVKITYIAEAEDVSLYLHNIRTTNFLFNLYTADSEPYTKSTLAQYLYRNGYTSKNGAMVLSAPPYVTRIVGTSTRVEMARLAFSTTGSSVSIDSSSITFDTNNVITDISVGKTTTTDNIESDIVSKVI